MIYIVVMCLVSCQFCPKNPIKIDQLPAIYPDYVGVSIPIDIAPLNFNYVGGDFDCMDVVVKGSKEGILHSNGNVAEFDINDWHDLTEKNKGGRLVFTVCVERDGKWMQFRDFDIFVSRYPLGEYGLTYRKIAPGYEVYSKMGIYQRNLSNYDESAIFENTNVPGACVNCHTSNRTDPHEFTFHIRGSHGATLVDINGKMEWLKAKNDSIHGSLVYPYWHPNGKYCAYSTNTTHQSFHVIGNERIEVFDQSSDILVYESKTHQLILDSLLMTKDHFETYPSFSSDGKILYFCSAQAEPIPERYQQVKYNLCKISFDPVKGLFGNRVDTIVNARKLGKSLVFPRPSYDGRYIMFTLSDYGCFPIWHKEADLGLLDLRTGKIKMLDRVNSSQTESFHNWNINSHWFVFSSRRGDGLYTRLYLASIDEEGHVSKPFLLPQKNPQKYYEESEYSYNIPDFTKTKVNFDFRKAGEEIMSDNRIDTKIK